MNFFVRSIVRIGAATAVSASGRARAVATVAIVAVGIVARPGVAAGPLFVVARIPRMAVPHFVGRALLGQTSGSLGSVRVGAVQGGVGVAENGAEHRPPATHLTGKRLRHRGQTPQYLTKT
jgi:hypothetical protein